MSTNREPKRAGALMRRRFILASAALSAFLGVPSRAAIVTSGDVSPGDPATWNNTIVGYVARTMDSSLTINGGSQIVSNQGRIGDEAGAAGVVTLDGAGSQWTIANWFYVGRQGTGTLSIANGGAVITPRGEVGHAQGSAGFATVSGIGSTWDAGILNVGNQGSGTLSITNGGRVLGTGLIALNAGSIGSATVDGVGSLWDGVKAIGSFGNATLNITNGGSARSFDAEIGTWEGSTGVVNVSGSGSTWTTRGLAIGGIGLGTLDIQNGGSVSSDHGHVGGDVNLDGQGSAWNIRDYIGVGGVENPARVSITNGARLTVSSGLGDGITFGSAVSVSGIGSRWETTGGISIGASGNPAEPSELRISAGGTVASAAGFIGSANGSAGVIVDGSASKWTNTGFLVVGDSGPGTLTVSNGAVVSNSKSAFGSTLAGVIGSQAASTGSVSVSGGSSTWTNNGDLLIGDAGRGNLDILGGGSVTSFAGRIADKAGSVGSVTVTGAGSKWTNTSALHVGVDGAGSLNIAAGAAVTSNGGIVAGHVGSKGVVSVSGAGSKWTNSSDLQIGLPAPGTMSITGGGNVSNRAGSIDNGSAVAVSGAGSKWINSSELVVDASTLTITDGALVSNTVGRIRAASGKTAGVAIRGAGSRWTNNGRLEMIDVSSTNTGRIDFSVVGGAQVTATNVTTSFLTFMSIDVDSSLAASGSFINAGRVRISASAAAEPGVYSPITAGGEWITTPAGSYQGVGGKWNATDHTLVVSDVLRGNAGEAVAFDRADTQRVLISDGAQTLGASFMGPATSLPTAVTASRMAAEPLAALDALLPPEGVILSDWIISIPGHAIGEPIYLSMQAGPGQSSSDLRVWLYTGTTWNEFNALDLAYDGQFASFTALGPPRVALTSPVPEPASATFLLLAAIPTLLSRRRQSLSYPLPCSSRTRLDPL